MEFFLATGKMTTTLKQHDGHLEVGHFVLTPLIEGLANDSYPTPIKLFWPFSIPMFPSG